MALHLLKILKFAREPVCPIAASLQKLQQQLLSPTAPVVRCLHSKLEVNASAQLMADRRQQFFQSIRNAGDNINTSQSSIPTIQKVHFILKAVKDRDFAKHFVPRLVSIGPYHHGKEHLKLAEILKRKFASEFMKDKEEVIMVVYDKILQDIDALRKCYDEEEVEKVFPIKEELAQMLFLDGCSVLHYIYCYVNGGLKEHMIRDHHVAFVHQDLFLLENQLPFRVLEWLIDAKYGTSTAPMANTTASSAANDRKLVGMEMIEDFIQNKIGTPGNRRRPADPTEDQPSHLLDLLRKRLVGSTNQQESSTTIEENQQKESSTTVEENQQRDSNGTLIKWNSFRNVSVLTAAGIHLKHSNTNSLTGVSFNSQFIKGVLKLPQIKVDDSTGPMFLNLIAYEMSPGVKNNMEVTTYICFLDSLIDHPDDVKQLRAAGILYNCLGSDEKVAYLFNEIGTDLVPNDQLIYEQVKFKIQNHCKNKNKTSMAQFYHTHFSSPWTILAFVWAIITVSLTAITSFSTLFSSK